MSDTPSLPPEPPRPAGAPSFEPPTQPAPPYDPTAYEPPPPPNFQPPPQPEHAEWGGPPPRPPRASSKPIWITLAVILAVTALAVGSCTVWFISTVKAPVDEANRFLAEIDRGDYRAAAAMIDPTCGTQSASDLNDLFLNDDIEYNLSNSSITDSRAEVSGSFSSPSLSSDRIEVRLSDLSGDWRVCSLRLG